MSPDTYRSPGPVASAFLSSSALVRFIMGPFGSGKTNVCLMDALAHAARMPVCLDGVRRFRGVVLRDTYANLWQTTIKTWANWFPKEKGKWTGSEGRQAQHVLRFDLPDGTKLHFEMLFLAIGDDRIEDVLRGIEFTWLMMNEADLQSGDVLTYAVGRVTLRRYPRTIDLRPEDREYFVGIVGDLNPPDTDSWVYELFEETKPAEHIMFKQPSGRSPLGENRGAIPREAYDRLAEANKHKKWWVKRMVDGQYGPSREGDPVYGDDYDDSVHFADGELQLFKDLPLRLSFDQGVTGPAMLIKQYTYSGQLRVLEELVPGRMGETRFGERCKILLEERYGAIPSTRWRAVCDPAGFTGGDAEGGDLAWAETVARILGIVILPAETNELKARIDGVSQLLRYRIDGQPALIISSLCPMLRKGFNSHYRYKTIKGADGRSANKPEKNEYSDPHDALQYGVLDLGGRSAVISGDLTKKGGVGRQDRHDEDSDDVHIPAGSGGFDVFAC
ncbi:MAG: hypothetical protein H6Q99_311 [Proteobacteria bacterium]|nr:hypothetical protein [Pseudomonadota bacterium]